MEKLNDPVIRKVLYAEIVKTDNLTSDPSTVVVDEFDVYSGSARIDVAVINGKLHGFEIKSERDNLDRLPCQVDFYNKTFDEITLVTAEVHLAKAKEIIPKWWGIYSVINKNGMPQLKKIRKPKNNKEIDGFSLTQLLWKPELYELLERNQNIKGIKSKNRLQLGRIAANEFDKEIIAEFVRSKLKNRKDWRALLLQQLSDDLL